MRDGDGDGDGEGEAPPAWIQVRSPEEASAQLRGIYRQAGVRSGVANVIGVHSLHPAAMEAHLDLYRTLMFGRSPLSRLEREALAVVVSAANDCFY